jgi:hypothetical protein
MTRPVRICGEFFVAFCYAEGSGRLVRFFERFRLESSRLRPICHQADASLSHEFNAMSLRLAITRLASPNRLNNCAAFLGSPLYRVLWGGTGSSPHGTNARLAHAPEP